jgi:hypothetical protein
MTGSIDPTASKYIIDPLLNGLQIGSSIFIALSSLGDSLLVINPGLAGNRKTCASYRK